MDDDVAIVENHPGPVIHTFAAKRSTVLLLEFHLRLLGEGYHMSSRSSAGNDKDVGEHDKAGNIQQDCFEALFVIDGNGRRLRGAGCLRMNCDEESAFPGWNVVPHNDREVHDC